MPPPSKHTRHIGLRISQLRKEMNLSSTELARRVGLSQPQISRLENGKQGFRSETLVRISKALGVTVSYFYGRTDPDLHGTLREEMTARAEHGETVLEEIHLDCGEVALIPGYRNLLKTLGNTLARGDCDARALRRLIERICKLNDDERRELLKQLPTRRSRLQSAKDPAV